MTDNVNCMNDGRTNVAARSKPSAKRPGDRHGRRHLSQQVARTDNYGGRGDGIHCGRTRIPSNGKSGKPGGGGRAENMRVSVPARRYCRESVRHPDSEGRGNSTDCAEHEDDSDDDDADDDSGDDDDDDDDDDSDDDDEPSSPVAKISFFRALLHSLFPAAFPVPTLYQARIKSARSVSDPDERDTGKFLFPVGRCPIFPDGMFVRAIDGYDVTRICFLESGQTFKRANNE